MKSVKGARRPYTLRTEVLAGCVCGGEVPALGTAPSEQTWPGYLSRSEKLTAVFGLCLGGSRTMPALASDQYLLRLGHLRRLLLSCTEFSVVHSPSRGTDGLKHTETYT